MILMMPTRCPWRQDPVQKEDPHQVLSKRSTSRAKRIFGQNMGCRWFAISESLSQKSIIAYTIFYSIQDVIFYVILYIYTVIMIAVLSGLFMYFL